MTKVYQNTLNETDAEFYFDEDTARKMSIYQAASDLHSDLTDENNYTLDADGLDANLNAIKAGIEKLKLAIDGKFVKMYKG